MMMAGIFGRLKSRATKSGHDRPSEVGHAAMPNEAARARHLPPSRRGSQAGPERVPGLPSGAHGR